MENTVRKIKIALLKILQNNALNHEDGLMEIENDQLTTFNEKMDENCLIYTLPFIRGILTNNEQELVDFIDFILKIKLFCLFLIITIVL